MSRLVVDVRLGPGVGGSSLVRLRKNIVGGTLEVRGPAYPASPRSLSPLRYPLFCSPSGAGLGLFFDILRRPSVCSISHRSFTHIPRRCSKLASDLPFRGLTVCRLSGLLAFLNFHLSALGIAEDEQTIPYAPVAAHDTHSDIILDFSKLLTQSVSNSRTRLLLECILIFYSFIASRETCVW